MLFATANGGRTHGKEQDKAQTDAQELPDLEQSKSAVLNSLTSQSSLRMQTSPAPVLDPASRPDGKYFTGRLKAGVGRAADIRAALAQLCRRTFLLF